MEIIPEIPGYKISREIGEGLTSLVYLGTQENLNRRVAIKILKQEMLEDKKILERFEREAKIIALNEHASIVTVIDAGQIGNCYYIIMEYLGESLKDRIQRVGKLSVEESLRVTKAIAEALKHAHSKEIVHRDLKPGNILFRGNETPVIVDFGLARDLNMTITDPRTVIGTFTYMSPEQCRGERADQLADIYSLGVMLFEMLCGELPYKGNWRAVYKQHMDQSIPVPPLPPEVSHCQKLFERMMVKDKKKRINASQLCKMIDQINRTTIWRN
ncbi:MAG: serine/threonine protein kinase [Candidatus Omnitrophota bacterium]